MPCKFASQMATQRFSRMLADIQRRLKPVLLSLCMALMLFAMGGNQFSAPGAVNHTPSFNAELVRVSAMQAAAYGAPKVGMPVESSALPGDREIPSENEPEEDFDSDVHFVLEQSAGTEMAAELTSISWVPYASGFQHSNTVVPLFVLHHSWKTFLS